MISFCNLIVIEINYENKLHNTNNYTKVFATMILFKRFPRGPNSGACITFFSFCCLLLSLSFLLSSLFLYFILLFSSLDIAGNNILVSPKKDLIILTNKCFSIQFCMVISIVVFICKNCGGCRSHCCCNCLWWWRGRTGLSTKQGMSSADKYLSKIWFHHKFACFLPELGFSTFLASDYVIQLCLLLLIDEIVRQAFTTEVVMAISKWHLQTFVTLKKSHFWHNFANEMFQPYLCSVV